LVLCTSLLLYYGFFQELFYSLPPLLPLPLLSSVQSGIFSHVTKTCPLGVSVDLQSHFFSVPFP
jgi:hypothetical protein